MQEQQEPAQIHIRIDTQEQRSGIPDLLSSMPQVHVELTPLRMGDYVVGGNPCRIFERKTGSDFLCSLAQGRLFPQLAALLKSRFAPILLLEGDPLGVSHSQMRPRSVSAEHSPTSPLSCACRSYASLGPADSAHLLYAVAKRCQVGKVHGRMEQVAYGPPAGRRRATQSEQQMHILLALPGIGHVTARAVCARFRSLHDLLNADAAQLATVPGVGPLRAAATSTAAACRLTNFTRCAQIKSGEDLQTQATYNIQEQELT